MTDDYGNQTNIEPAPPRKDTGQDFDSADLSLVRHISGKRPKVLGIIFWCCVVFIAASIALGGETNLLVSLAGVVAIAAGICWCIYRVDHVHVVTRTTDYEQHYRQAVKDRSGRR